VRTFLDLVPRDGLPAKGMTRIGRLRTAGQAARVLFRARLAPDLALPGTDPDIGLGPIHVVASADALSRSYDSWREGVLPASPLVTLRVPSLADPRLAPLGKAVMTATVSAVPSRLSEGPWTEARREQLVKLALGAAERAAPGVSAHVLANPNRGGARRRSHARSHLWRSRRRRARAGSGIEFSPLLAMAAQSGHRFGGMAERLSRDCISLVHRPRHAPLCWECRVSAAASAILTDWETLSRGEAE